MSDPDLPLWERRFRAPQVTHPHWGVEAPERLVYASNETGTYQVWALDRSTGERRRVTDVGIGTTSGAATPDGTGVVWFDDRTGDEIGVWVHEPFEGGDAPAPLLDGVPDGWSAGLAMAGPTVAVGLSREDGYEVWVGERGGRGRLLHRHDEVVEVGGLSRDGALLCIAHAEHGDPTHLALRVLDVATGEAVGDLWDGDGLGLEPAGWSPVPGDARLALVSERAGSLRPGVWDPGTGARHDIELPADMHGDATVAGWWPDGGSLLVVHTCEGRDDLLRVDVASGATTEVPHPAGTILAARVRPAGDEVWYAHTAGSAAPSVRSSAGGLDGLVVLAPEGEAAPPGHQYRSWHFTNPAGERVHGFLVEPEGCAPPYPLVLLVHGGPHWLWEDAWRPEVPAWVDHGYAVALVNYRGSTGYGREWRDRLHGDPGFPELEDLCAAVDDLVGRGLADPARVVLAGASWGGYLTLLGLGRHPERWRAGVAVVPVADYVAAFEDEAPMLQSLDRMLFGGTPEEVRDLYEERSPISYVDRVAAPVLVIAGENDTRCPIRQIRNYLERLAVLGKEHETMFYDAGHGSMVVEERVRFMARELEFVLARVPVDRA